MGEHQSSPGVVVGIDGGQPWSAPERIVSTYRMVDGDLEVFTW